MLISRRDMLALALGAAAGPGTAAQPSLRIVTTHLPPLVMDSAESGGEQPGALRELVEALCGRLDIAAPIAFMPWRRALHLAGTMPRTAIFPLTRMAEREAQFRWLAPLYEENFVFLAPRRSTFDVAHPAAMTEQRIALLRGAAQSAILAELGYRRLVEASSIDEVHRFMLAGMADAAFGERAIIRRALRARGHETQFRVSAPVRSTMAWLGGSLDIGEAEAARYRATMAALVADGTQRRIFRRYGLA